MVFAIAYKHTCIHESRFIYNIQQCSGFSFCVVWCLCLLLHPWPFSSLITWFFFPYLSLSFSLSISFIIFLGFFRFLFCSFLYSIPIQTKLTHYLWLKKIIIWPLYTFLMQNNINEKKKKNARTKYICCCCAATSD